MPFLDKIYTHTGEILIWHITENEVQLKKLAQQYDLPLPTIQASKRFIQTLAWQICLNQQKGSFNLIYEQNKPFILLKSGIIQASITHNNDYSIVYINNNEPCGIDIELPSDKQIRVRHKICTTAEQDKLNLLPNNKALVYSIAWSCKEALYKKYNEGYNFKESFHILKINFEDNSVLVKIETQNISKQELLSFILFKNQVIVYTN